MRNRRRELRMSQMEANNLVFGNRKSAQYWSNVENRKCQIASKHLKRISEVLQVSLDDLVDAYVRDYKESIIKEIQK